jgi:hypothetical protein
MVAMVMFAVLEEMASKPAKSYAGINAANDTGRRLSWCAVNHFSELVSKQTYISQV